MRNQKHQFEVLHEMCLATPKFKAAYVTATSESALAAAERYNQMFPGLVTSGWDAIYPNGASVRFVKAGFDFGKERGVRTWRDEGVERQFA